MIHDVLCSVRQQVVQQVLRVLRELLRELDIKRDEDVSLLTGLLREGETIA